MQVGSGTGYYAAVLAEIVGPNGRVIAVECDDDLAAKARDNLRPWAQVEVVHGDGRTHDPRRGRRHHRFRRLDPPRSHLARSPDPRRGTAHAADWRELVRLPVTGDPVPRPRCEPHRSAGRPRREQI
ncbi:MAG TPA: methyltransferase domain-containing protein [Xanthobacteraceae bacterium]|nr:methyltransferase domain-containing protein [Xanthobacteraceae bacterium]